ncbi:MULTISPECIES: cupin domain-containing protein [Microvirga]|uniref:cupin domain-containing protein n=1 Tax=Microvirga TaxID=186650 RepID=UPI001CFDB2E0|nr:cupin domain-containing protein [Microvirga lenta]MCB5173615.1 cupin domain-containing protein [Microvirga lenta]
MDFDVGARLKEIRIAAGLSQRDLAVRAGVTHGLISMIEQNRNSPSVASLRKILGGVSMTMADFFQETAREKHKVFYGPDELIDLTSKLGSFNGKKNKRMTLRQVGNAREHGLQILHERYEPGADTGPTMLEHASHEGGIVISGELEVTVGDQVQVLRAGDAYLFDSRIPHRFRNLGSEICEVVSACTPPYL